MNANHSFRTSITVLTVATIVGCAVMLFSGFSQFRLRPAANDQALVSTANQKLRNRFGEFYPVEPRVSAGLMNSPATNTLPTSAQTSTFDEVVTTTSEYDSAEVTTSWSSVTTAGMPQVSVPVTINVNNGELMSQLIETRESLAEMKAQQSAIRQDQRVFSYQVHKDGSGTATASNNASTKSDNSSVADANPNPESAKTSTLNDLDARGTKTREHQTSQERNESFSVERTTSSEVHSASTEIAGRSTSRMKSVSEDKSVRQSPHNTTEPPHTTPAKTVSDSKSATDTIASDASTQEPDTGMMFEFETENEASVSIEDSASNIEEEISFGPISTPKAPDDEDESVSPVPAIEPIGYSIEETLEESSSETVSEETIVEFASLDESKAPLEAPASLPELNIEEPQQQKFVELPVLSLDHDSGFPGSRVAENDAASTGKAAKSRQTREQLATAFAAVRGLPPEDLFADRSTPFVTPIEPAEPVAAVSSPGVNGANNDSKVVSGALDQADGAEASPPTILFADSTTGSVAVLPSSAAAPVELEFGEPTVPNPALTHSENPGSPENPVMLPAEAKPERWHKYRSRVYRKQNLSPSTPVPPVPEIARTESQSTPSDFQEPPAVPPALENSLVESGNDLKITDSPLMIPDDDGTTEFAQNSNSEKLGSASMPPIPQSTTASEQTADFDSLSASDLAGADSSVVYEMESAVDQLNQISTEMNAPPLFSSSPPMHSQRKMPQKSASKLPFETTFRRINKRVAWMTDALKLPESMTAQHKPALPKPPRLKSPTKERPAHVPHPPAQGHGPAVARKSAPAPQKPLPKLNAPKFTVQNFSLPNVNFRAIQAPAIRMPMLDTPDWLACPPDVMAPVRNSNTLHRVMSTMQFAGQSSALR